MTKAKTNALDALRTLIAERQQYEQWIGTLEAKREGTPEHVYDRVRGDYQSRLERVVSDIRGHAEELQLSISTLSSRLVEVAREEDTRREGLQEAELRAAVGEYEPDQWEQLRTEAERSLEKIAADRESLDSQLSELRAIQKLSEVGSPVLPSSVSTDRTHQASQSERPAAAPASQSQTSAPAPAPAPAPSGQQPASPAPPPPKPEPARPAEAAPAAPVAATSQTPAGSGVAPTGDQVRQPLEPVGARSAAQQSGAASASGAARVRTGRTPPSGSSAMRPRSEPAKPDNAKTLKCPECGTANYPTEWYCERCGGELATM